MTGILKSGSGFTRVNFDSRFSSDLFFTSSLGIGNWDRFFLLNDGEEPRYDLRIALRRCTATFEPLSYSLCRVKGRGVALKIMRAQSCENSVYFDTWLKYRWLGDGEWVMAKYSLELSSV